MGSDHCVVCNRIVTGRQQALSCDTCLLWQHRICESGITQTEYRRMVKQRESMIPFTCNKCKDRSQRDRAESTLIEESSATSTSDYGRFGVSFNLSGINQPTDVPNTETSDINQPTDVPNTETSDINQPTDVPNTETSDETVQNRRGDATFVIQTELDASFDVQHQQGRHEQEIVEDSIQEPELLNSILEDGPVTYTTIQSGTQRKGVKLVSSDGYEYTKKSSRGDFIYWRCSKRGKNLNCTATVSQKGDIFKTNSKPHIHQAEKGALKRVVIQKEVKKTALEQMNMPAGKIVDDVFLDKLEEHVHDLPKVNNLKRLANRVRSNLRPTEPTTLDFEINVQFLQCQDFLIGDVNVDAERHLIFATSTQLELLKHAKRWFCDGTFKIVAKPFTQMWSIHAFIRKGNSMKQVPLVFCLMSRRKTKDYRAVFQLLKEKMDNASSVEGFVTDFEKGAWKAIREEFSDVSIKGCSFHFSQAIWRKTQELGLKTTYSERGPEYRYIRSLLALPFLPSSDIEAAFKALETRANSPELKRLVRYIESSWIRNSVWPPQTWSIYETNIRTNNDVEGWHTRVNTNAGKSNLSFYVLVPLLRREADLVDVTQRLVCEEQVLRVQRALDKDIKGRLHKFWSEYAAGEKTASQLIRECGKIYGPAND